MAAYIPIEQKFHVGHVPVPECGCWIWERSAVRSGKQAYGEIKDRGKRRLAHRVSYELHIGPIPNGMQVCHRCDIGLCVNPAHLFLSDNRGNQLDMVSKGRQGNQKLNAEQALEIYLLAQTGMPQWRIAERFGVCQQTVSDIFQKKRWTFIHKDREKWLH